MSRPISEASQIFLIKIVVDKRGKRRVRLTKHRWRRITSRCCLSHHWCLHTSVKVLPSSCWCLVPAPPSCSSSAVLSWSQLRCLVSISALPSCLDPRSAISSRSRLRRFVLIPAPPSCLDLGSVVSFWSWLCRLILIPAPLFCLDPVSTFSSQSLLRRLVSILALPSRLDLGSAILSFL